MAARSYTAEELIETVKLRASLPNTSTTGTADADILRYLNEEQLTKLVPWVMRFREEYFVASERLTGIAGQTHFRISPRAIGNQWRDVVFISSSDGNQRHVLPRIAREEIWRYESPYLADPATGFYIEGNHIVLLNVGATDTESLEVPFFFRPSEMVLTAGGTAQALKVTAVDTATKQITWSANPPADIFNSADLIDVHSGSSGAEIKQWDLTIDTLNANDMLVDQEIDGSVHGTHLVEVGDWVCVAQTAGLPALPRELHPTLAQAAVCRMVEAMGDVDALKLHKMELNEMLQASKFFLENRVKGRPQKMTSKDSPWYGASARGSYSSYY